MRDDLLVLFTHPLWLDEWHVALVARHASLAQVLSDLRQGSDFAPPLLHVATWLLRLVVGDAYTSPVLLRVISAACVAAATAFVFLTLRRRLAPSAAALGALALFGHSIVIEYMFQWRFYAPWLCFAAFVAWALALDGPGGRPSRRRDVALAVGSVLLCTIHWFGVISLGLMCLGAIATYGRDWRAGVLRALPAVAGLVALAICLPFMFGQRGSIRGKSWMPDPDLAQVVNLFRTYWLPAVPLCAAILIGVCLLFERTRESLRAALAGVRADAGIAALASLAVFPIVIAIVSLRQPALLPRYSMVTFLAWAPLVAVAVQPLPRLARGVVGAALALLVAGNVLRMEQRYRDFSRGVVEGQAALTQACQMRLPVLFLQRHTMYAVTRTAPPCEARILAMSPATMDRVFPAPQFEMMRRSFGVETEFAVMHERLYGFPRVARQDEIDSLPRFLVIESDPLLPPAQAEGFAASVFPSHRVGRVGMGLMLAARPPRN